MERDIANLLARSLTPYHAVKEAEAILKGAGFKQLSEGDPFGIERGGSYYAVRDGSALIAFKVGKNALSGGGFGIVASHTDSPCLKIKLNAENASAGCTRLEVETYGGGLNYTRLDIPLKIAGRAVVAGDGGVCSKLVELDGQFVIPSLAIHYNRAANDGVKLNAQVDMQVLAGLGEPCGRLMDEIQKKAGGKVLDYDLFAVADQPPFRAGFDGELLCSPRADNLTSAFASIEGLINSCPQGVAVAYLADNEEVGSRTKQGAGSTFLKDICERISAALGRTREEYLASLASSMMVSCDNAHAIHPNHPELSDPQNKTVLGGGVVIKHHANQNYTTDAMSSAVIKQIFDTAGVKRQDFFMRSDLPSGGTLGAISSTQLSIRSVDIGIAQLAMHSAAETFALADYAELKNGLSAFYSARISSPTHDKVEIK